MSWSLMADVPNPLFDASGDPYSGAVLKAYLPGTTTSTSLAIDSAGSSPQASITYNAEGKLEVSGNEILPYIDRKHKWAIFSNATDATANTPFYMGPFDNVDATAVRADNAFTKHFATLAAAVADTGLEDGDAVSIKERLPGEGNGFIADVVLSSTVTENTFDIIQCTGVATVSLVIRIDRPMTTKMFGVLHDSTPGTADGTDDTAALQRSMDRMSGESFGLISSDGTAAVDAVTRLQVPSNIHLTFSSNSEWAAITNAETDYRLVNIANVQNVFIYNPVLTGDKDTHTGSTGEQGHCLNISSNAADDTNNIHIYNPICTKAWGDGIVVRKGRNLHFYDAFTDDCRRNGITVNKCKTLHFHGTTTCTNTSGISPEAGFDIEPNDSTGNLRNLVIDKLYTQDNVGPGLTFNIGDYPFKGFPQDVTVNIGEHVDKGSVYGLNAAKCAGSDTAVAVTFADTGDLVTYTAHPFSDGFAIRFSSIATTTGITAFTTYYVINSATNTFQVAATLGGSALPLTTDGTGVITTEIRGALTIGKQTYMDNDSAGVYVEDYGSTNTPTIFMKNLSILDPNEGNSSSILFGAGMAFDRKAGSGLTNNIGNVVIDNLIINDARDTTRMTYGITALDNDSSGAALENVVIKNPIKISGYDASATELQATRINMNGAKISDDYDQLVIELTADYTITKNVYSKITATKGTVLVLTDDIPRDNSGVDLVIVNKGAGGVRFDPDAARAIFPLSATAGKYIECTEIGGRITIRYNLADDDWYVIDQIGTWSVEP